MSRTQAIEKEDYIELTNKSKKRGSHSLKWALLFLR